MTNFIRKRALSRSRNAPLLNNTTDAPAAAVALVRESLGATATLYCCNEDATTTADGGLFDVFATSEVILIGIILANSNNIPKSEKVCM